MDADGAKHYCMMSSRQREAGWVTILPSKKELDTLLPAGAAGVAAAQAMVQSVPGYAEATAQVEASLRARELAPPAAREAAPAQSYPSLLFLGTASSQPSKYRNVTGILLETSSGNMALDVGEASANQLVAAVGLERSAEILRKLHLIFNSHHHADHHAGTILMLLNRLEAFRAAGQDPQPIVVVAGPYFDLYFHQVARLHPELARYTRLVHATALRRDGGEGEFYSAGGVLEAAARSALEPALKRLRLKNMETVRVSHCKDSCAVILDHADGWRIVWSGDTRPSDRLAELGRDATILIHEATFANSMLTDAQRKMHCTVGEALSVARKMRAKTLILTHFSQRYNSALPSDWLKTTAPSNIVGGPGTGQVRMKVASPRPSRSDHEFATGSSTGSRWGSRSVSPLLQPLAKKSKQGGAGSESEAFRASPSPAGSGASRPSSPSLDSASEPNVICAYDLMRIDADNVERLALDDKRTMLVMNHFFNDDVLSEAKSQVHLDDLIDDELVAHAADAEEGAAGAEKTARDVPGQSANGSTGRQPAAQRPLKSKQKLAAAKSAAMASR